MSQHTAPPPLPEDVEMVHDWAQKINALLADPPNEVRIKFTHGFEKTADDEPVYGWQAEHHTLPGRTLVIGWGMPHHGEDCECILPPKPMLTIVVVDPDTQEEWRDSADIRIEHPRNWQFVMLHVIAAAAAFDGLGSL